MSSNMTSTQRCGDGVKICAALAVLALFTTINRLVLAETGKSLEGTVYDPKRNTSRRSNATDRNVYYECRADKKWTKCVCAPGELFDATKNGCRASITTVAADDSAGIDPVAILSQPQFQAPDDICSGGIPLTRLSAPVVCNPSASSCPDGYHCTLHSRTGTSYCCQNVVEPSTIVDSALCTGNQITYFDPSNGLPKSCVINSCPIGFGCNLVSGGFTRCCGRNFGCPANSAGFVKPHNGAHLQCNAADPSSCPAGFVCTHSSMFNTGVCCSDTSTTPVDVCSGEAPLSRPNPCSASAACPAGYTCRNGRCCPSKADIGLCPAGNPLGGVTSCTASNPCPNNYQCVTTNGQQYCCPAPEHVCRLARDSGMPCKSRVAAATRFYFDVATGSCRAFQFSQCGGNGNNFDTVEQCESFCLDAQCPHGAGLRAGPALATCAGAGATQLASPVSSSADSVCPSHYTCAQPLFGSNNVCCTSNENVCRDTVTSGTVCFGPFMTIQRFHYNAERGQCEPFQYYGCNGSGNNFLTKQLCENACQPPVRNACNGVAPLNDESDYVQRCSDTVPCQRGSWCNSRGYCCPHPETACQALRSIGHTCLSQRPGTYWYFDTAADTCLPFIYSGCGGTPNRFASREACEQMCVSKLGDCPRGMTPFLASGSGGQRQCSINVSGSCPEGSSCVLSTLNEPICCTSTAQCPVGRVAYVIPGSDSHVACIPDDDNCPHGHQCMRSSNVAGFYMCCSSTSPRRRVPGTVAGSKSTAPRVAALIAAVKAGERHGIGALALAPPHSVAYAVKCPAGLASNGQRCTINEIEGCLHGYLCIGDRGGSSSHGVCCKASPKCHKHRKPYFVGKKQARSRLIPLVPDDEAGCPRGSVCTSSSIDGVDICCLLRASAAAPPPPPSQASVGVGEKRHVASAESESDEMTDGFKPATRGTFFKVAKVVPKCRDGALPYFALGSRVPQSCKTARDDECPEEYECDAATDGQHYCCPAWDRCPNNASPFLVEGSRKPLGCNWMANNCPEGYSCEGSKDRAICCRSRPSSAQCPAGRSAYLYAKRPLICPPGKRTCPFGYECTASRGGGVHLCCSDEERASAECVTGRAYFDPTTNKNQLCDPALDACPAGYQCSRSTLANAHVCCSDSNSADNRYDGYCPPGQIPYTGMKSDYSALPTCHMAKSPCPTTAPYQCIYSPEKQNSYCCAPVDMTHRPSNKHSRKTNMVNGNQKVDEQQHQQKQQKIWMQQQQQSYQQQLQYQQQAAAAEYAAATATASKLAVSGGCANAATAAMYPDFSSELTQLQLHYQQQQQQQHRSNNQPQYPSTTVIDPSAANKLFVASCPPWSKPLLNPQTKLGHACSSWNRCPSGFTCYSNFPDGRNAHCCTTVPLDNQVVFRANTPEAEAAAVAASAAASTWSQPFAAPNQQIQYAPDATGGDVTAALPSLLSAELNTSAAAAPIVDPAAIAAAFAVPCPQGTVNIGGQCKRMYFVGQQGCDSDLQCRQRTNGTHCLKNYCSCDPGLLIYESRCIRQCPEGFLSIAGRCHDLTTVVFMESVEERASGMIGGYCADTVVREEQCHVANAYCNERSITCQCLPGYELHMDFGNKNDSGSCQLVEDSTYNKTATNETNPYNAVAGVDDAVKEKTLHDDAEAPRTFFIIGDDNVSGRNVTTDNPTTDTSETNNLSSTLITTLAVEGDTRLSTIATTENNKETADSSASSPLSSPSSTSSEITDEPTKFTTAPKDFERIISTKFNGTLDDDFFQSDD